MECHQLVSLSAAAIVSSGSISSIIIIIVAAATDGDKLRRCSPAGASVTPYSVNDCAPRHRQ